MPWMTRSPHKANVCLHQHLKIPAGSTPTATRKTPETTLQIFSRGYPAGCTGSALSCAERAAATHQKRTNRQHPRPGARRQADLQLSTQLLTHPALGCPHSGVPQERLCTAGHHTSQDGNTVAKKQLSIYHNMGFTQSTSKLCVP